MKVYFDVYPLGGSFRISGGARINKYKVILSPPRQAKLRLATRFIPLHRLAH